MAKKKIFVWSDSPTRSTGFGIVAKNLLRDVHKEFDLEMLGINNHGDHKYNTTKWFLYSTDPMMDPYGFKKLPMLINRTKPDLIFLFQDIFHVDSVLPAVQEAAPNVPIIVYYPIDGVPVSKTYFNLEKSLNVKKHFIYSEFADRELTKSYPNLKTPREILYHGIDFKSFHVLPEESLAKARKVVQWENKFVMTSVNVFQPRKFIMATLRAGALLRYGYKRCECGNYYALTDETCPLNGCGPTNVTSDVPPKEDVLLYMHMGTTNQMMGPGKVNLLPAHALNAGWSNNYHKDKSLVLLKPNRNLALEPFSEEDLNVIYNLTCVNVTSAVGEGFGFNLAEASACGTTTIAPNNSVIDEILGGTGHVVKNCGIFTMGMDCGHMRPIVDIGAMVDALELEYQKWVDNDRCKVINEAAIKNVRSRFHWGDKRDQLMKAFRRYA